jgi:hypothetical protein
MPDSPKWGQQEREREKRENIVHQYNSCLDKE